MTQNYTKRQSDWEQTPCSCITRVSGPAVYFFPCILNNAYSISALDSCAMQRSLTLRSFTGIPQRSCVWRINTWSFSVISTWRFWSTMAIYSGRSCLDVRREKEICHWKRRWVVSGYFLLKPVDTFGKQYCPKAHTSCITTDIKNNNTENLGSIGHRSREKIMGKTHSCFRTFRRVMTCV